MDPLVYTFGGFQIDAQFRLLLRDGLRATIPPKAADLLILLLERNGELIGSAVLQAQLLVGSRSRSRQARE
jgi:DNA-binding winged helix-turn-helix (wHTH) protein